MRTSSTLRGINNRAHPVSRELLLYMREKFPRIPMKPTSTERQDLFDAGIDHVVTHFEELYKKLEGGTFNGIV